MLLVAPAVMMTACATSPASKPLGLDRDPVIEARVRVERVCPAELADAPAPLPARPGGGYLEGDKATLEWVGAIARGASVLESLLADARRACPASAPATVQ